MKRNLTLLLLVLTLGSCQKEHVHSVRELFPKCRQLTRIESNIADDDIALIEGLICDGENLIVYDLHSGDSYTLFDRASGACISRFGTIGQGPGEIPSGCYGYLSRRCFSVFDDRTKKVMQYHLDSLRKDASAKKAVCLAAYDIPDACISRLVAVDDSTFFGAGTYDSRYQYLLFNQDSEVLAHGVDVYNAHDDGYNQYTRFLSNQCDLVMQPGKRTFACSVNFSSNLDIVKVADGRVEPVKSWRLGNPVCEPKTVGGLYQSADITRDTQTGYINLSATARYVYALYSDKKLYENGRKSDTVLVFDWEGNAIERYSLDAEAHYIAVDDMDRMMYAAVKNEAGGWSIACYSICQTNPL